MRAGPALCLGISIVVLSGTAIAAAAEAPNLVAAAEARDAAAVRALLATGADAGMAAPDGTTALHWAAHWNDVALASELVRAGAEAGVANDYGATPLTLACTNASAEMVDVLLAARADVNAAGSSDVTPLMSCARTGSAEAVRALLARGAIVDARDSERGQTALMWAAAQGHADAAQALIDAGADVNGRSEGGFTPLLFAARIGDVPSAHVLLDAGAEIEARGPLDMTPILMAAASGREDVAIYLLERGANPNAEDSNGASALHYSVLTGITTLNQIRYANYVDHLFRPSMKRLAAALLERGADPNAQIDVTPLQAGDSERNGYGATAFVLASAIPDPEMMRLLVDSGADPSIPTMTGLTGVMVAAGVGRGQDFTEEQKLHSMEAVRYAIELGNDPTAANAAGLTALHGAAANGAMELVEYLVALGADINASDNFQQTPLSIASGMRLPWIPYGQELGEIMQPQTADLLLTLGATPLDTPGYFTVPDEMSDAYRINMSQRYGGANAGAAAQLPASPQPAR